ncbi:MAG: GAF domain-containing protein [Thermoanaerobaculia bacterium]
MSAKLTVFPPQAVSRYLLFPEGESRQVGRDPGNDLVLEDPRVSARHARLQWRTSGWTLMDLASKNGTFVNGMPVDDTAIADEDWISFGGLLSRFEVLSAEEVRVLEGERRVRWETTAELRGRLGEEREPRALLRRLLESVLQVTSAERGFVLLLGGSGELRAEVAAGFPQDRPLGEDFRGSLTAVSQALETGKPVVASDARGDAVLGKRPSVVELGIRALACVPLRAEDRTVGVLYVDGQRPGGGFTELDLEILGALADHASLVVAGCRIERRIRELLERPAGGSDPGEMIFFDQLERSLAVLGCGAAPSPEAEGRSVPS